MSFGGPLDQPRARTPAFIKSRTASRMTAAAARGERVLSPQSGGGGGARVGSGTASWAAMSGSLPHGEHKSMRLTSVHVGSSRFDTAITFPEYSPSPKAGPHDHGPDPVFAHDKGVTQGSRKQHWAQVTNPAPHHELTQVNWASSGLSGFNGKGRGQRMPRISPIKKNHTNSTKRELELYGGRPVSPTRARQPGAHATTSLANPYDGPMTRPARDGSFGEEGHARVYKPWHDSVARGANTGTGTHDGGAKHSAGVRGRVPAVGLNSGNICVSVEGY